MADLADRLATYVANKDPQPAGGGLQAFRATYVKEGIGRIFVPSLDKLPVAHRVACRWACRLFWTREPGETQHGVATGKGKLVSFCPVPDGDL